MNNIIEWFSKNVIRIDLNFKRFDFRVWTEEKHPCMFCHKQCDREAIFWGDDYGWNLVWSCNHCYMPQFRDDEVKFEFPKRGISAKELHKLGFYVAEYRYR